MRQLRIAAVGAGGKTTALRTLAQLSGDHSTLFTTTTHIFPLRGRECRCCLTDPPPEELSAALGEPGVVCAGSAAAEGKLGILPEKTLAAGLEGAELVMYEGDGSRRHPLKLHREGEPVLLPRTDRCLVVAGLSALGKPVEAVVHRYELAPDWKDRPGTIVGSSEFLRCVLETVEKTGLSGDVLRILLNQEDAGDPARVRELLDALRDRGLNARAGSLRRDPSFLWDWVME